MPDRNGKRKTREQLSKRRVPELGYYFIVTDTKETEQNYLLGLRDSIPKELQGKLVIKVCRAKTAELVNEALNMASLQPQYGEPWIVFDRDQVKDFDKIVSVALEKGINVGWSNPCIEIWLFFAKQEISDSGYLINYMENAGAFGFQTTTSERELFQQRRLGLVNAIRVVYDKVVPE